MRRTLATAALAAALLAGCNSAEQDETNAERSGQEARLDDTFRIDVSQIDVAYDYWPADARLRGRATLRFEMRPGQSRPVFYFNPLRTTSTSQDRRALGSLELDGEALDPSSPKDLRAVRSGPSAEPAFEAERRLSEGEEHTLQMSWSMPRSVPARPPGWLYSNFDDTQGPDDETEALWPSISSPEELARHRIRLRVHSKRRYVVMGSGTVKRLRNRRVHTWELDTGWPVPTHTVLVAAVPARDVRVARFRARGVPVRIVSDRRPAIIARAKRTARDTIGRLVDDFGPFPMPRMDILLTGWGSGMEYYGATRTGIASLEHELVHMYFGTSAINETWRDTWFDEAAVVWWLRGSKLHPLRPRIRTEIVGARTPVQPGFDTDAYGAGARILEEVADALGSEREMTEFMADLYRRRAFHPFTTDELIDDIVGAQDEIGRQQLERWLYEDAPG